MEGENQNKKAASKRSKKEHDQPSIPAWIESRLKWIEERASEPHEYDSRPKTDADRSMIVRWIVKGYVITVIGTLIFVPIYNLIAFKLGAESQTLPLKDVMLAVSGLMNGALGYVVGHYFKRGE